MHTTPETSDAQLLDLLRTEGARTVVELTTAMRVTPTAVRQRLARLQQQGLVEREISRAGRGRPRHRYSLTELARRRAGNNFADLAIVLWRELRAVRDPELRRGLLARVVQGFAGLYSSRVEGNDTRERMQSVSGLLAERDVPFAVEESGGLPVLVARDCPYPQLAEEDRGICAVEKMLFSELLQQDVRLAQCRLDGHACCQFQTS
ncbi:MAG: MarR family transcriptional regulator [Pirellulales bacterium]|nr:MarR family transcriptional regulator [Pirellulales bacterium]